MAKTSSLTIYGGNTDLDDYIYTVLVSGDRNWYDDKLVENCLRELMLWCEEEGYEMHVVSGRATGADESADKAAKKLEIPFHGYPAPWDRIKRMKLGNPRSAGPRRNAEMRVRHEIDLVLAFHDNIVNSKGTKNMIDQAKKENIEWELISH